MELVLLLVKKKEVLQTLLSLVLLKEKIKEGYKGLFDLIKLACFSLFVVGTEGAGATQGSVVRFIGGSVVFPCFVHREEAIV